MLRSCVISSSPIAQQVSQILKDAGQDDVFFDAVVFVAFEVNHESNLRGVG